MEKKSSILSKEEYLKKYSTEVIKLVDEFQKGTHDAKNLARLEKILARLIKIKEQLVIILNTEDNAFIIKLANSIQAFQKQLDELKKKRSDSALDFLNEDISDEARKKLLEQESPFDTDISTKIPRTYGGKTDTH